MKWKKPLTVATLVVASMTLAACAPEASPPEAEGGAPSGELTIDWVSNEKAGIEAVIAEYAKFRPEVTVTLTTGDPAPYQAQLRTKLSAGTASDVMYVWPSQGLAGSLWPLAEYGFLAPLEDADWPGKYPASIQELTSFEGSTYIMAPLASSFEPAYNQDALDEAGLTAPATWSDMLAFCSDARDAGKTAYAIAGSDAYAPQAPVYNLVPDLVYGVNPDFDSQLASGEVTFADSGYLDALHKYEEMVAAGCFQDNPTGTSYETANELVATGAALGEFFLGTRLAALKTLAPDVDFRIHAFDSGDSPESDVVALSTQGGAAINAKAKNSAAARDFVAFLAGNLPAYVSAHPGTVPTIANGFTPGDANQELLVGHLERNETVHFLDQLWPDGTVGQAMISGLQGLLGGSVAAEAVLDDMQAKFDLANK